MSTQKKKRSASYSRTKGNNYERQIARELVKLGFSAKCARNVNHEADSNKVDIVDEENLLPPLQLKKTINIPNYFKIRSESTVNPEEFCLLWAKQEAKEKNICTVGEIVLIPKSYFYKLIQKYYGKSDCKLSRSGNTEGS